MTGISAIATPLDAPPFSVETLAARWGVSGKSIRHMIQRGEISAFRLGGKLLRIPASEVARIEGNGTGAKLSNRITHQRGQHD